MRHVIIGAGAAGVAAAQTIIESQPDAEVILFGEERFFPYKRYLLTELLCGGIQQDNVFDRSFAELLKAGIKLRKGEIVKEISPSQKTIRLHHNEVVPYDRLLIATGGSPELGPVLRPFRKHIQRYYSMKDILVLQKKLPEIQKCIVFGDGLSSLDLLCGLTNLGKKVTYIIQGSQADFALLDPIFSDQLHQFLESKGIEIIVEDRITRIDPMDSQYQVATLKQKELTADIVFAWDYYAPNIPFIEGSGIEKEMGILVDQNLQTSVKDIYAAGDCVEIYHPGIHNYWINFGWPNAVAQGMVAGQNMTGQQDIYKIRDTIVFNIMGKPLKARWWK